MLDCRSKLRILQFTALTMALGILVVCCSSKPSLTLRTQIQNIDDLGPSLRLVPSVDSGPTLLILPAVDFDEVKVRVSTVLGGPPLWLIIDPEDQDFDTVEIEIPPDGKIDTEIDLEPGVYWLMPSVVQHNNTSEPYGAVMLGADTVLGVLPVRLKVVEDQDATGQIIDLGATYILLHWNDEWTTEFP